MNPEFSSSKESIDTLNGIISSLEKEILENRVFAEIFL